jgi:peptidyl-dipeptidase Dcp
VLAEEDRSIHRSKRAKDELAGLPQSLRDAAAAAAESKKQQPGTWVIMNTRSSIDPFLTYSDRRDLREKAWRMFVNAATTAASTTTTHHHRNPSTRRSGQTARLSDTRTLASRKLDGQDSRKAMELMEAVWKPAVARVHEEVADMQALADKEGAKIKIEPWDYRYYMEKVRKAKFDLDQNEIKPYLQLEKLREGIFWVPGELFNFNFTPVTNVPVAHPDIRVWEVH